VALGGEPVTVSNEDRALVNEIVNAITWGPMLSVSTPGPDGERAINLRASAIVREVKAALIAHGWGPRPAVSATEIEQRIFQTRLRAYPAQEFEAIVDAVTVAVIATGIEVTE
jgi:hypothetical protein